MFRRLLDLLDRRGRRDGQRAANLAALLDALETNLPVSDREICSPAVGEHVVWSGGEQCGSSL